MYGWNKNAFGALTKIIILGGILSLSACCAVESMPPASPAVLKTPGAHQEVFATPGDAVDALVSATRGDEKSELMKILGPHAWKLIHSGDKVADERGRERFLAAYDKAHRIESESGDRDRLIVGEEEWPMPVPLMHTEGGWWFDAVAGEQEILDRRIGHNELNAIGVCRAYVEAQQEFAARHPLKGGKHEYAEHFQSSDGQHDGLYWPTASGQPESPFGLLVSNATAEGYEGKTFNKHVPYEGYFFRILKRQGPHAPEGAKDYVVNGHMTRGFALIAFPARYGDSGVMTFIVNRHGIVYEKNLGSDTAEIARNIAQFDPDGSWNIVR